MTNLTGLSPDPALLRKLPVTTVDNSINHGTRVHGCVTDYPPADASAKPTNLKDRPSASLKLADLIRGAGRHYLPLIGRIPKPGGRSGSAQPC